ncbi:MAG TPA: MauE/DoxX family redox-associated membrane protein [Nocardioides sp.]|uniref:MauE/DoxX family redox-associated membrane protein n=1 Tax=uncultured Nocardioides sp. TaxID=198441 RepID=UPI0026350143|nr:MauE/DoxX family redox-associated membrane protein [uncultured Nocardioides sp.]HRD60471.1 MauE/DoxX family redox-associated membrane protein [Nocardioides sp.]HRI94878.1 MauE/DoxX family redox-associated membrane protein [Nocardioides sp.]HRK45126.1 MauE/DoxX family redox-associated membrane protein [Nocardioides sp.]
MKEWLGTAARLVTGGVWIWAALLKLPHPDESVLAVRAYQLLPGDSATTVGHLLPVVELVVGICLVLGLLTRFAAAASALLFAAFIIGIASVWARGIEIDCGCFGGGGAKPGASSQYPWEIARDVALLAASLFLVWLRRTRLALDNLLFPSRSASDDLDLDSDLDPDPDQHRSGV